VRISTTWDRIGGIGGLFECVFVPRVMRAIYADVLKRLGSYAGEHCSASADHTLSAACPDVSWTRLWLATGALPRASTVWGPRLSAERWNGSATRSLHELALAFHVGSAAERRA
jgi:hypothetical protein